MTSGARNSGVPKFTRSFSRGLYLLPEKKKNSVTFRPVTFSSGEEQLKGTYTLARPKSMILILFVTLLTQRMFSGWYSPQTKNKSKIQSRAALELLRSGGRDAPPTLRSRWRMYILCMCCRPSQICLMKVTASSSISV